MPGDRRGWSVMVEHLIQQRENRDNSKRPHRSHMVAEQQRGGDKDQQTCMHVQEGFGCPQLLSHTGLCFPVGSGQSAYPRVHL